tara:strand:+ start:1933 stop:2556 length:624 start_codon:yes stop_codon:yes gene_type:complete
MNSQVNRKRILTDQTKKTRPAIFLDRDGVIIKDKHYLKDPNQTELHEGAKRILGLASKKRWHVVIITNQSGISRGLMTWDDYEKVTDRMIELLDTKNIISGIYSNSLGPNAPRDSWRKPSPKMILEASIDLNINLKESILIGDRLTDLEAGINANLFKVIHILTGHGQHERHTIECYTKIKHPKNKLMASKIFYIDDLTKFSDYLLK